MERNHLVVTALALALALMLVGPTAGWARAEIVNLGDVACGFDLGLRVSIRVDGGALRAALELPGRELASITLGAHEAVRWGIPILTIVTEFRNARIDRLDTSRSSLSVR